MASDYYLNGLTGNDANDGTSPVQAVATPARLKVVMGTQSNLRYWVASDSIFRGTLDTSLCPGAIGDIYAGINPPIFLGDDIIAPGSFTKTAGKTNVYQADVTTETGTSYQSSFEGGSFHTRAADLSGVDSTAGSFIPCAAGTSTPQVEEGSLTLYIHPYGNTDPRVDGKVYSYSKRQFAYVDHVGGTNIVRNMTFKAPHAADGVATIYGQMITCSCLRGNKHNVLVHKTGILNGCTVNTYYWGGGQAALVVCNDDAAGGGQPQVINCTITGNSASDPTALGIQIHQNTSGPYAALHVVGNTISNVNIGVSGGDTTLFDISGNTIFGVDLGVSVDGAATLTSNTISAANACLQMANQSAPHAFVVQNNSLSLDGTVNFAKGILYCGGSTQASSLLVDGNTFSNPVTAWCINCFATGTPLTIRNNRFTGNYYIQFSAADMVSARNDRFLTPPAGIFNVDGVSKDIAYFQATFGDVPVPPGTGGRAVSGSWHPWLATN